MSTPPAADRDYFPQRRPPGPPPADAPTMADIVATIALGRAA